MSLTYTIESICNGYEEKSEINESASNPRFTGMNCLLHSNGDDGNDVRGMDFASRVRKSKEYVEIQLPMKYHLFSLIPCVRRIYDERNIVEKKEGWKVEKFVIKSENVIPLLNFSLARYVRVCTLQKLVTKNIPLLFLLSSTFATSLKNLSNSVAV